MKILHVGGFHSLTVTHARYQIRNGCEAHVWGGAERDYAFEKPFVCIQSGTSLLDIASDHYDIVHFHSLESLPKDFGEATALLNTLKGRGIGLCYSCYGADPELFRSDSESGQLQSALLREMFDHIFIGTTDGRALSENARSWSWTPIGLDISSVPQPKVEEPPAHDLRILHIPYRLGDAETETILNATKAMKDRGFKFTVTVVHPEEIESVPALRRLIKECHLFIEQISRPSFGLLAIDAMAHGKTVLSGNSPATREAWQELAMCPVLDTNETNLIKRLESILREPRCLRDLGKRSRTYAQAHHNAEVTNQLILGIYRRLRKS